MNLSDLVYINANGYYYADYNSFLEWRKDQYRTIYGADIYLEADSQDGQLVAIQALADYQTAALGASIYASFSPTTAQGVGLSRNVKINGISRLIATKSNVSITIVGTAGTVITNGIVQDSLNQLWDVPTTTIPTGGTITVIAIAQEFGAVTAAAGTVTRIYTPTRGWQSVTNAAAANAGNPVESDAELRVRQARSVAIPSLTVFDGTIGAIENITGVEKVKGYENQTGTTDGDGIPGHSICVVVLGGTSANIASAILLHKTPGCNTYGNTPIATFDSRGMPITISFQRPTNVSIKVAITISVNANWSSDYITLMQTSVANYINALSIGSTILITKLYSPAYLAGTAADGSFDIASLQIAKGADPLGNVNIDLDFDDNPVCVAASDVTVIVT